MDISSSDLLEFMMGFGLRGIAVQVVPGRNPQGAPHVRVREAKGNVEVTFGGSTVSGFEIPRMRQGIPPTEIAQLVVSKSMSAMAAEMGETLERFFEEELIIYFDLDFITRDPSPDIAIAAVVDALYAWAHEYDLAGIDEYGIEQARAAVDFVAVIMAPASLDLADLRVAVARKHEASLRDLLLEVRSERAQQEEDSNATRWLPSLLAVPYELIDNQGPLRDKFDTALVTFEFAIRYMVAVALAPVEGETRPERIAHLQAEFGKSKPALGDYVALLRRRLGSVRSLLPETIGALRTKSGRQSSLGQFLFGDLAEMRNSLRGHSGVTGPQSKYVEPYQELREHLDALVGILGEETRRLPLVERINVDFAEGSSFDYTLRLLRGASAGLPKERMVSNERLDSSSVYLWLRESGEFVRMDPLVRYDTCPKCGSEEAFLLDHFDPKKPRWYSARAGHAI